MKKSKVKRRPLDIVDRCIDLQYQLDEYRRFCGDLIIRLIKSDIEHTAIEHDVEEGDLIWDKISEILKENRELREKLAQFSQGKGTKTK